MTAIAIERLVSITDDAVQQLAAVLVDAVDSGAGVSFMAGLKINEAESLGWMRVGVVPNFALNPDGSPCDTVFFCKQL